MRINYKLQRTVKSTTRSFILTIIASSLIMSCTKESIGEDDDDNPPIVSENTNFEINFNPMFNGQNLTFNEMKWVNDANDTMNFTRLRMILSNFQLVKPNGDIVDLDTFAYISFDEGRTVLGFEGEMPQGEFNGINFQIGLDSAISHGDPMQWPSNHPLNPLVNHMHWTWATGYIFWVTDGYFRENNNDFGIMSFHMANQEYRRPIRLSSSTTFSFSNGKVTKNIEMNMDKYFSTPNPYSLKTNGPISHSTSPGDKERMTLLHANMETMFSLK